MRPVVNLRRPSLLGLRPLALLLYERDSQRCQHPHDLRHGHVVQRFHDQQVDQIVGIRQTLTGEAVDGDPTVLILAADIGSGLVDVLGIGVEALHQIVAFGPERGSQFTVRATDVNDQTAAEAARCQELFGFGSS